MYVKRSLRDRMDVYQTGGSMIEKVTFAETTFAPCPTRYEAGTPHIAGAIALAQACRYIQTIGFDAIASYEDKLYQQLLAICNDFPRLHLYGRATKKIPLASFTYQGAHPHDIATIMDSVGVALRAGHHCAMPLADYLGVPATARVSLAMYNTPEDLEAFRRGLEQINQWFKLV